MAGQFTWTYDAPDGVYKSHAMSNKLRYAAIAEAVFTTHARPEPGFGRKKGDTVTITRTANLAIPTDAAFAEGEKVPIDTFAMSTTSITVEQLARGVEYNDLAQQLSTFDLEQPIQKVLRNQMKLVLDTKAATAFKSAAIKFVPTTLSGGSFETTLGTTALVNLNVDLCGVIRDYLTDTIHAPFATGNRYIGIGSTKALRGIKSDPLFLQWRQYIRPGDVLMNSEVGEVEQIRWVECNYTSSLSNTKGSGSVLGEAVVFGDDAVAMIEASTPELRAAIPANFGLDKSVAWYGVLAYGIVWETAIDGEARIIHVTSA